MKRLMLFLLGVVLGVGLALLIGWEWFPRIEYDAGPAALRVDYQEEYIRLVALAYEVDHDSAAAIERLVELDPRAPTAPLVSLTEAWIAEGKSRALITPLVALARDLGAETPPMTPYLPE
jgi:hypothetical protein